MFFSNMIIIYTNSNRLFRIFNSELILGIMVLLAIVTSILAIFLPYRVLSYEALTLCAMIVGFLVINKVLCYRPGNWVFKIRRLQ